MGEFPTSVAYFPTLKTACVVIGGAKAGVSCSHVDLSKGLTPLGKLRPLSQGLQQASPPTGPPLATSDIAFNPSSTLVFVTSEETQWRLHPHRGISTLDL